MTQDKQQMSTPPRPRAPLVQPFIFLCCTVLQISTLSAHVLLPLIDKNDPKRRTASNIGPAYDCKAQAVARKCIRYVLLAKATGVPINTYLGSSVPPKALDGRQQPSVLLFAATTVKIIAEHAHNWHSFCVIRRACLRYLIGGAYYS